MDRKSFLVGSAAATTLPVLCDESTDVIDTHTHFYDTSRPQGAPWPRKTDPLYRPILPKEFLGVTKPHGNFKTVAVEASPWIEDNDWLLKLAKKEPCIVGIVGNVDPLLKDFDQHITRLASHKTFRGIRVKKSIYKIDDKEILRKYKKLVDLNLSIDVNGGVPALEAAIALNKKLPELRQVINHLPYYNFRNKDHEKYLHLLKQVEKHPQIFAKISAVLTKSNQETITDPDYYIPILKEQWKYWGSGRVIFGSNWPVSKRLSDYSTLFQVVEHFLKTRTSQERKDYLFNNSQKAYQWV